MTYEQLEPFRRNLLGRRDDLVARQKAASRDERELVSEREPDWPDAAARDTAATVLETLGAAERAAVEEIDAALDRMAHGTYGECARCGAPVGDERLRAVPETTHCERCATLAA